MIWPKTSHFSWKNIKIQMTNIHGNNVYLTQQNKQIVFAQPFCKCLLPRHFEFTQHFFVVYTLICRLPHHSVVPTEMTVLDLA